jgi:uncharacterized protein YjiS (DUF1127 family)
MAMLQLTFIQRGFLAVAAELRCRWRGRRREKRVRIEHLSRHLLRDLGLSTRDALDLTAAERSRYLS